MVRAFVVVFASLWAPVCALAVEPMSASIQRLAPDQQAPVVDGALREPVWHQIEPLEGLRRSEQSPDISHVGIWRGATARACWDDEALYVAVMCRVWEADRLVVPGQAQDDEAILQGDWVGLSVSSGSGPTPRHWFVVDPANLRWDAIETQGGQRDTSVNPRWRSAVGFRDDRFIVEMAIPWNSIGGKPDVGEKRRANIVRNCLRPARLLTWSPVPGMEAKARYQGTWTFAGPAAEPSETDDPWHGDAMRGRNPQAIAELIRGQRRVASAAWWGFDPVDSTRYLQAAIDSGAAKVVVPNMGQEWVITPVVPASHQELFFEPGVVVTARKGAFHGRHDALFRARNASHVTLTGYGATLRMHKRDYQGEPYARSEWRHGLDFESCNNLIVQGLTIRESGGDGIVLASWGVGYNKDVIIRDCVLDGNHRQGISVISAENLLIENCLLRNTSGTGPSAGIDFEPDEKEERLVNCIVRNCVAENNDGTGFTISTTKLSRESKDVSILLENCHVRGGKRYGFNVSGPMDGGPQGTIEFRNCHVENVRQLGVRILDKSSDRIDLRFVNCSWKNVGAADEDTGSYRNVPILFHLRDARWTNRPGGVVFVDCVVIDDQDRPFMAYGTPVKNPPALRGVEGNLTILNPHGARIDLGSPEAATGLRINTPVR